MDAHPFSMNRTKISLLVTLITVGALPFIPGLTGKLWLALVVLAGLLGVFAVVKKAWVDAGLALYTIAGFTIGHYMYPGLEDIVVVLRTAAILAFILLNVTLLIGPWAHFVPTVARTIKYRRHIGVTAFLLGLTHANLVLSWYFNYTPEYTYTTTFVFFGSTGLYVLSAMALTSWDIAQKKIPTKWWNVIHTGLLVGYVGYIAFFMQYVLDLATWHKVTLSLFLLFWVCMTPWGLPKKLLRRVSGWKQLHMLVYIAYASLVIHIWTGTLEFVEAEWLRMGFWALTILVVGSHVVGWVMMLARRFAKSNTANDSITVEGKTYLRVGGTADFLEGKGKRIDIGNLHVAVFKYNNGFFGMSAECPHQKGPIADGKIVNGFVECPWHRYQFGVTDGFGPAEFKDCIPYYKAVEQNGAVYLCSESTGKCDVH